MRTAFKIDKLEKVDNREYVNELYKVGHIQGSLLFVPVQEIKRIWSIYRPEKLKELLPLEKKEITCCANKQYPPVTNMVKSVGKAIVNTAVGAIKGEDILRTKEEIKNIMDICRSNKCGFFNAEKNRCFKCGCKLAVKTTLKKEHCPIGLW